MTTLFVSAVDGNNADDGLSWANAKQTVAGALAIAASNDIIKVDSAGTFTATAAITWTPPAGNVAIISVDRANSDAWLAGATESVGASNNNFNIAGAAGSKMYVYGMTINGGSNNSVTCIIGLLTTSTVIAALEMRSCTINLNSTSTGATLLFGASAQIGQRSNPIRLRDCTLGITASRAGTYALIQKAKVELINPTFNMAGATKPAILFAAGAAGDTGSIRIVDGDLTGYAVSSGAYFSVANFNTVSASIENCKISATPTLTTGTWPGGEGSILLRNVDSGDTLYTFQYVNSYGTLTADTAVFITTGGAAFNGAGVSWKIVTSSLADEFSPFVTPQIAVWNTTTTAQTSAIEIIRDNATALTDRNIWSSLDFPASASFPNYTFQTNRNANPFTGTPANQPTSTATWTGTGGFSNPTKQKLENAFTAAEVGLLEAQIYVGVASTTLYIDPYIGGVT